MYKTPIFKLSALALMLLSLAPASLRADDGEEYLKGSVGLGGEISHSKTDGSAGGIQAQLAARVYGYGPGGNDQYGNSDLPENFIGSADGSISYNMIGGTESNKLTTGVGVRGRGAAAYALSKRSEGVCDFYVGGAGQIDGGLYHNRSGANRVAINAGPETGLLCQLGDVMIQASPSVGVGYASQSSKASLKDSLSTDMNMIQMGGRLRVVVKDRLAVSADGFVTPRLKAAGENGSDNALARHGSVNAEVAAGKWAFTGYAKGQQMYGGANAEEKADSLEIGAIAGRAF